MAEVTVTAQYIADTVQYVNNVKKATDATNQFAKSMPQAEQASNRMKASTVGLGAAMGTLGAIVFAKAASAVTNFAQQGIAAAASYEQTVISMQGIFQGSGMSMQQAAKKTESYLAELRDFAARTPFELPQTLDAVKRLLSIGYAADDVKDRLLPAVGDITAALGQPASAINGVVYAFGQMKSAGRVLSQDLMQIGNALPGFNAKMAIAKELFNGDVGAMTKAMESGSLDSTKAIDAIISAMQKFPGAAGAMERQSKTLNGVISTFKDTVNNALIDGLMPAIPVLSGALEKLVGPVSDLATAFAQALGPALIKIVESAQTFVPILTDFAVRMLNFIPTLMNVVGFFLRMAPAIAAVAGPLAVVALGFKAFTSVKGILDQVTGAIGKMIGKQLALNAAVLANPYVAIAAVVVAALAAMALAFKWVYDRSEQLRTATAVLIQTIQNIVGVIVGDLLAAWKSITGQTDKATGATTNIGDIMKRVAEVAGGILSKALEYVGTYLKVIGTIIRVIIKAWEILIKIIQMVVGVFKTLIVEGFKKIQPVISWVLDHLGPLGAMFRNVGKAIQNAFANLPGFLRGVMSSAVGMIEGLVNKAIGAVNFLIDQYNKLPGLADIGRIADFQLTGFGDAGAQVAADAAKAAAIAAEGKRDAALASRYAAESASAAAAATTTTTTDGAGKAKKQADELKKFEEQLKGVEDTLNKAAEAYKTINDSVNDSNVLFGEQSKIMKSLGKEGDIGSAVAMYDQLDSALRDYYGSLEKAAGSNKKLAAQIKTEGDAQRAALKASVQTQINLYRERERINKALNDLEKSYADKQGEINKRYDNLDKQAQANIDGIEARYAKLIPTLEKALAAATAAYDKENAVLQDLISKRDDFLKQIGSGFRSFMNQFTMQDGGPDFRTSLEDRLAAIREFAANIKSLVTRGLDQSLIQEFVSAGVSGAGDLVKSLAGASAEDIAAINATQTSLANEITGFQEYANQQWFAAGIAQQEAIVAPLQTAAQQAQLALDLANSSRETELAAARAHAETLKAERAAALEQARIDYENQKASLIKQGEDIDNALQKNAENVNAEFLKLQQSMPPQMMQIGKDAMAGLLAGLESKRPALVAKARSLAEAMNAAFRATLRIGSPSRVMKTIGQQVAEGLILGMEGSIGAVEAAAVGLAQAAVPTIGGSGFGFGAGGVGAGGVVVESGAVQISVQGSLDGQSAAQIEAVVDEALLRLAREIRRSG